MSEQSCLSTIALPELHQKAAHTRLLGACAFIGGSAFHSVLLYQVLGLAPLFIFQFRTLNSKGI